MTRIIITPGDPDGIGPEITWKAIRRRRIPRNVQLLVVGARKPFEKLGASFVDVNESGLSENRALGTKPLFLSAPTTLPKKGLLLPGYQSGWSIQKATSLIQAGHASALVTGPISKERLQRGGFPYSGHTDFLADLCKTGEDSQEVTMMLANDQLRVSLVTVHCSIQDVPKNLTRERLRRTVIHTAFHLRAWWGIRRPKIAVAALNPHAGEKGLFGREEIEIIAPEVRALQSSSLARSRGAYSLHGPLPADTLFANLKTDKYDAVVCMYHDQGLIPVKLLDFPHTVNVTLGLPIVRTSVDHGTGFDIAGLGKADPSSLESALDLAIEIVRKKKRGKGGS